MVAKTLHTGRYRGSPTYRPTNRQLFLRAQRPNHYTPDGSVGSVLSYRPPNDMMYKNMHVRYRITINKTRVAFLH